MKRTMYTSHATVPDGAPMTLRLAIVCGRTASQLGAIRSPLRWFFLPAVFGLTAIEQIALCFGGAP